MLLILLLYFSVFYDVVKVENNSYFYKKFTHPRTNLLHMKPLKLILTAVLGFAVVVSGFSVEQKKGEKPKKEKTERVRVVTIPIYVTDVDNNPLSGVIFLIEKDGQIGGAGTNAHGTCTLICESNDTAQVIKEGYITQIIPLRGREELNLVMEKIPEDLLPAKDSTEKK